MPEARIMIEEIYTERSARQLKPRGWGFMAGSNYRLE